MMKQVIFYISDGTGITAETLGHTLVTQFDSLEFEPHTLPYINTKEKALLAVEKLEKAFREHQKKPLVIATIIDDEIREIIQSSNSYVFEFFNIFLQPISKILHTPYTHVTGRSHGIFDQKNYKSRLDAINIALTCDDGMGMKHYKDVDIILLGPSRSGKTPTCLYLALQFGISAANYPLISGDLERITSPDFIQHNRGKLFGLIVDPKRLHLIRKERASDSKYSSETQCIWEINRIEKIYKTNNIPYMNATNLSIEEISTRALEELNISRKLI